MSPRVFKQKGSRVYRGRYRLGDDLKVYDIPLHTEIKEVAEAKLRKLVREKEEESLGLIPPKKLRESAALPLENMLSEMVANLVERKRCEDHVRHTRERLTTLFSKCRWRLLRDVTSEDFIKWRSQSSLSAKTKNEYLGHAVAFFNWLVRNDRFTHNPLKSVTKLPTVGEETFKRRALTLEEFVRLVEKPSKRRLAYFLACCTGLRRGELQQLRWTDVDLSETEPVIRLRPETTKNKKGGTIPLLPALAVLLRKEKARRGHHFSGLVLSDGIPGAKTLAKDLVACGVTVNDERGYRVDFHALRHTFISLLAHAKVSELVRMKLARHSAWKQTDGYTDSKSVPLGDGIAMLAAALPSSLASLKSGKIGPNLGNVVQTQPSTFSEKITQMPDLKGDLGAVVPDWENGNWRRGGDSNPR